MLKRLAILGILLIGVLACAHEPLPVNGNQKLEHLQPPVDTNQPKQPHQETPPCISEVCKENADNAERYAYYEAHPKEYFKAAITPANLSNWILAGLGIIGGIVACVSLIIISGQNKILKDSVAAAQKSADAFVNSERARLAVFPEFDKSIIRFYTRNSGRSPALIKFALVRFHVLDSSEVLPRRPDYLNEEEDWSGNEEWLGPDQTTDLQINDVYERMDLSDTSAQIPEEVLPSLKTGKSIAWFYGYIRYRDGISADDKLTRFIYSCYWTGEGVILLRDRRDSYNLET